MTHQTRHVFSVSSVQLALDVKFGFTWKTDKTWTSAAKSVIMDYTSLTGFSMLIDNSLFVVLLTDRFSGPGTAVCPMCVAVCPVRTITFELNDLWPRYLASCFISTLSRSYSKVKVVDYSSRSPSKKVPVLARLHGRRVHVYWVTYFTDERSTWHIFGCLSSCMC